MRAPSTLAPHRPATDLLARLRPGRANPRTADELSDLTGASERQVRASVEWLRRQGHLIGSTSSDGGGFYLVATPEELEDTARHLTSRARNLFITVAAMRRAAGQLFGPEALRLFDVDQGGSDGH